MNDEILESSARRLGAAGFPGADRDARALLAVATSPSHMAELVERRASGEPLEWIVGCTTFAGHRISVAPGVYVPRPQSEGLARRAVEVLPAGGVGVDLCTGSGAIAVHLALSRPMSRVAACDIDARAVGCAARNGVAVVVGDLDAPFASARVDVVTAVAPYVPRVDLHLLPRDVLAFEPRLALEGGPDGLDVVRRVILGAARILRRGGWLLTELGGDQDEPVHDLLAAAGFVDARFWQDDEGDLRGVEARRR